MPCVYGKYSMLTPIFANCCSVLVLLYLSVPFQSSPENKTSNLYLLWQSILILGLLGVDHNNFINTFKRRQNSYSVLKRINRLLMLYISHIIVVANRNNQMRTHSLAFFKQIQMSDMKDIKYSGCEAYVIHNSCQLLFRKFFYFFKNFLRENNCI